MAVLDPEPEEPPELWPLLGRLPRPTPPPADLSRRPVHFVARRRPVTKAAGSPEKESLWNALAWLESTQNRDGGWGESPDSPSTVRDTSLALLAFAGDGDTPLSAVVDRLGARKVLRGDVVKSGLKWLLERTPCDGIRTAPPLAPEDLALGALAVSEMFALTRATLLKDMAQAWTDTMVEAHCEGIEWRWGSERVIDVRATAWAVLAVRMGREACLTVPASLHEPFGTPWRSWSRHAIDRSAMRYVARCMTGNAEDRLAALHEGIEMDFAEACRGGHDCETAHWTLLAKRLERPLDPDLWDMWKEKFVRPLCARQRPDGSWDAAESGPYARTAITALNARSLEVERLYDLSEKPNPKPDRPF